MTTFQTNNQIVFYSEKFGLITEKELILKKGSKQNSIDFESINRINLIKKRVFYFNTALFVLSLVSFLSSFLLFDSEKQNTLYSFLAVGFIFLLFSIVHKFYEYRLVIKEKNQSIVEIKTNQLHRKCIKEFYTAILKKVPSNKKS